MIKGQEFDNQHKWHSRGFLPHYDAGNKYQMITYRLADSLPVKLLPGAPHSNADKSQRTLEKRKAIEKIIDLGYGACTLGHEEVALKKIEAWKYFDGQRYDLIAYVVMPNHVHLLIKTYDQWPIAQLVASWKKNVTYFVKKNKVIWQEYIESYISYREAYLKFKENDIGSGSALECGAPGKEFGLSKVYFWQREYWDRFIRDEKHFNDAVRYILENPVKAGFCQEINDWPWSSH